MDQKGSLVTEDKLRFDYNCSRAPTLDELNTVEREVCDVIARKLPVHFDVVPLKSAQQINGLRAVFGEHYPDPVRVVSVGPSVNDLLSTPDAAAWMDCSVEFCGGTHISNTEEAQSFAIIGESLSYTCWFWCLICVLMFQRRDQWPRAFAASPL